MSAEARAEVGPLRGRVGEVVAYQLGGSGGGGGRVARAGADHGERLPGLAFGGGGEREDSVGHGCLLGWDALPACSRRGRHGETGSGFFNEPS
jgi:hypothetical protein